jgi:hypothetical protein
VFKKVALTVSAVAFIMLAIALALNVPTALATVHATISNDAKSSPSASEHTCAAFEVWFLNAGCRPDHVAKASRTKRHLTRTGSR